MDIEKAYFHTRNKKLCAIYFLRGVGMALKLCVTLLFTTQN